MGGRQEERSLLFAKTPKRRFAGIVPVGVPGDATVSAFSGKTHCGSCTYSYKGAIAEDPAAAAQLFCCFDTWRHALF